MRKENLLIIFIILISNINLVAQDVKAKEIRSLARPHHKTTNFGVSNAN